MKFQSTLPRGERHVSECFIPPHPIISIHAPTRGATYLIMDIWKNKVFQSTLPRGERLLRNGIRISMVRFQSTLPRGERRNRSRYYNRQYFISIHAPTRGATERSHLKDQVVEISIHAPTRGATKDPSQISLEEIISIHAPTRGATDLLGKLKNAKSYFNPRSHEGSDSYPDGEYIYNIKISIHAPTRGATCDGGGTSAEY